MEGFGEIPNPERNIESMESQIEKLYDDMINQLKYMPSIDTFPDEASVIDEHCVLIYHRSGFDLRIVSIENEDGSYQYYSEDEYKRIRFERNLYHVLDDLDESR